MDISAQRTPLVIGSVSTIRRLRLQSEAEVVISIREEMRAAMNVNAYLSKAPFKTVSLILNYGHVENLEPDDYRVDKRSDCLCVSIQLDGQALAELDPPRLKSKLRLTLIEVLCDVAANFDLPYEFLDAMRYADPNHVAD